MSETHDELAGRPLDEGQAEQVVPVAADEGGEPAGVEGGTPELTNESMPLGPVVEALLFASDIPLSVGKIAETVGLDATKPVRDIIEELNKSYEERQAAYRIEERAGGYQLLTLPQYADYIQRMVRKKDEGRLTPASLETLAIVAYKQPIVRAEVKRFAAWRAGKCCGA